MARIDITVDPDESDIELLKRDVILNATPSQIDNWVNNNVTDLASAREAIRLCLKIAILKP